MRWRLIGFVFLALGALGCGPASAASVLDASSWAPTPLAQFSFVQEVRFGGFAHNLAHNESAPVDVSVETLSSPLGWGAFSNPYVNWFLSPRINLGAMVNTEGKTSYVFGGFTWRIPLWGPVFFEGEFGGALNNAVRHEIPNRINMGCPTTFRESGGFGVQVTPSVDIVVNVEHISHLSFCNKQNPGITHFGFRVGYKF
jgi:lipid A 3-O-deacylase